MYEKKYFIYEMLNIMSQFRHKRAKGDFHQIFFYILLIFFNSYLLLKNDTIHVFLSYDLYTHIFHAK